MEERSIYLFRKNHESGKYEYYGLFNKKRNRELEHTPLIWGKSFLHTFLAEIGTWGLNKETYHNMGLNEEFDMSKYESNKDYGYINYGSWFPYNDLLKMDDDGKRKGYIHKDLVKMIEVDKIIKPTDIGRVLESWECNREENDTKDYVLSPSIYNNCTPEKKQDYAYYEWEEYDSPGYTCKEILSVISYILTNRIDFDENYDDLILYVQ